MEGWVGNQPTARSPPILHRRRERTFRAALLQPHWALVCRNWPLHTTQGTVTTPEKKLAKALQTIWRLKTLGGGLTPVTGVSGARTTRYHLFVVYSSNDDKRSIKNICFFSFFEAQPAGPSSIRCLTLRAILLSTGVETMQALGRPLVKLILWRAQKRITTTSATTSRWQKEYEVFECTQHIDAQSTVAIGAITK